MRAKRRFKRVTFGGLAPGDVFRVSGDEGKYLKTGFVVADGGINAVDFDRGRVRYFDERVSVIRCGRLPAGSWGYEEP